MISRRWGLSLMLCLGLGFGACSQQPTSVPETSPTSTTIATKPFSPSVTVTPKPSSPTPTLTLTPILTPSTSPTLTFTPTPRLFPSTGSHGDHFIFTRPIDTWVDFAYRYGTTHGGTRETHHGTDLLAECGTPVQAAGAGEVVIAGGDWQEVYGPYQSFYGNLVIIQHSKLADDAPLFTLYGHLSTIAVDVGEVVSRGDVLGEVGFTGAAIGCHLHFEVRQGENTYDSTRNPELWIVPHQEDRTFYGAIAGRLTGSTGYPIPDVRIEIQRLDDEGDVEHSFYTLTYADQSVNGDDLWHENFAVGDVEPGRYRVQFVVGGLQKYELEVLPGQLAFIEFDLDE